MDRRHLPLTALRSFEAVGRHLSFTRAAEALGVTHGAVSRQIASLERSLGVKLIDRGVRLTLTEPASACSPASLRLSTVLPPRSRA
jgi:LysR family glycine cleavage system transcriptional activator